MSGWAPANRLEAYAITAAANGSASAPVETLTNFTPGFVVVIELEIPDGHLGLTGIRFLLAGSPVIPATKGAWINGNDDHLEWNLTGYLETGVWSVSTYNTDVFAHTFYVRYLVNDQDMGSFRRPPVVVPTPLVV